MVQLTVDPKTLANALVSLVGTRCESRATYNLLRWTDHARPRAPAPCFTALLGRSCIAASQPEIDPVEVELGRNDFARNQ
jgi:hypothetical protein